MKIGIITWFTYENYGTKLQALALQGYLKKQGYSVELLNFQPPSVNGNNNKINIKQKIVNKIKAIDSQRAKNKYAQQLEKRSIALKKVIEENCTLTQAITNDQEYITVANTFDLLICGSDQIWNPNWFHPYYFAGFEEIKVSKVAYAPSIGVNEIGKEEKIKIQKCIKDFNAIAMREKSGQIEIQKLTHLNVKHVLDPTLLMNESEWEKLLKINDVKKNKPYICCYFLGDNKKHWDAVLNYAKQKNMEIKIIPQQGSAYFQKGQVQASAGVEDFVELIKNAKLIFTDSFHATVFSTIFHKDFYVFERFQETESGSQNSRIYDFLNLLDLKKRLIKFGTNHVVIQIPIDYNKIEKILNSEINQSKIYLEEAIKTNE